jgi:hypothetical protein
VLPITYTPALSPNGYPITNYNLTLQDVNHTLLSVIYNGLNTSVYFDTTSVVDGQYHINITATDFQNQTSYSESDTFTIDNSAPIITFISPTPINSQVLTVSNVDVVVNVTENNFKNITYYLYIATGTLDQTQFFNNLTTAVNFVNLLNGVSYKINVSACDTLDNCGVSETRTFSYNSNSGTGGTTVINNSFNSTLTSGQCTNNMGGINIMWMIIVIALVLLFVMLIFELGIAGLFAGILFIALYFNVVNCSTFLGMVSLCFGIVVMIFSAIAVPMLGRKF